MFLFRGAHGWARAMESVRAHGWAKVEQRRSSCRESSPEHDSRDGGGRIASGTAIERPSSCRGTPYKQQSPTFLGGVFLCFYPISNRCYKIIVFVTSVVPNHLDMLIKIMVFYPYLSQGCFIDREIAKKPIPKSQQRNR